MMKVFLWMLREAGVRDVPSFASLRKMQSHLRTECGISTHQYKSAQGNTFFMNDLREIIAKVCEFFRQHTCLIFYCVGLRESPCPSTPPLLP